MFDWKIIWKQLFRRKIESKIRNFKTTHQLISIGSNIIARSNNYKPKQRFIIGSLIQASQKTLYNSIYLSYYIHLAVKQIKQIKDDQNSTKLFSDISWMSTTTKNILFWIEGSCPNHSKNVIQVYFKFLWWKG